MVVFVSTVGGSGAVPALSAANDSMLGKGTE